MLTILSCTVNNMILILSEIHELFTPLPSNNSSEKAIQILDGQKFVVSVHVQFYELICFLCNYRTVVRVQWTESRGQ